MNFEKFSATQAETHEELKPKYATMTVLLDENDKVAVIEVTKHGYYKIPGGGIEENEIIEDAAKREVREEAGCNCELVARLGTLETPVPVWDMLDISDGYIAKVIGEKATPEYEDWEKERGFKVVWFDSLDDAINIIEDNAVTEPGMDCLQERDLSFLKLARDKLKDAR